MASAWRNDLLRDLRTLFEAGTYLGHGDGELLDRFSTRGGEGAEVAFAALVTRHGPMVLKVCRRVLADSHDVEDAFQATFLVLVEKAGSIRSRESVASWLYGVAFRVASCARAASARRRRLERKGAESIAFSIQDEGAGDLGAVVHEEVARLPEKYRAPIVLCDLEGHTYDEAARQLVWPVGTVKSRLARGRDRLRDRLARRGLAPTTLALAAALVDDASAALPSTLHATTVRAATQYAAGSSAVPGAISASVAALTEGVLKTMFLTKLKAAAVALLAVGILGTAAIGQSFGPREERPPRDDREADRLRGLERKLDNVLEMLERQTRDRQDRPPVPPAPPAPAPAPRVSVAPRADLPGSGPGGMPGMPGMPGMMAGMGMPGMAIDAVSERFNRIERRLQEVERRLAEFDERLSRFGETQAATQPSRTESRAVPRNRREGPDLRVNERVRDRDQPPRARREEEEPRERGRDADRTLPPPRAEPANAPDQPPRVN